MLSPGFCSEGLLIVCKVQGEFESAVVSLLQNLVTICKCVFIWMAHIAVCHYCRHPERMHLNRCWHTNKLAHTCAPPLSDTPTHRAISNQSQWLLCSSLNGRPDLRYAELFPPSPNFQATGEKKKVEEKLRDQRAWDSLQTFNSFHLASQFTESRDHLLCNEKVGWEREWSLLRKQPSAFTAAFSNCQFETVKMHSFWVIIYLSFIQLLPTVSLLQVEDRV